MLSHVRKHSGQSAFGCLADTALCDQAGHQTRRCDVKSRIAAPGTFGHDLEKRAPASGHVIALCNDVADGSGSGGDDRRDRRIGRKAVQFSALEIDDEPPTVIVPAATDAGSDGFRRRPNRNTVYDLASLTKVVGLTTAMMWAVERPDGGRGFGFTGGHFHDNWGNDDFRKVVLNATLWIAKAEIPEKGVQSTVSKEDLDANLDPKKPR